MNSNMKMANDQKHMPSNSNSNARSNSKNVNSNHIKRKVISPEEVIQLFSVPHHGAPHHSAHPHLTGFLGHHHHQPQQQQQPPSSTNRQRTSSGSAIINENQRGRKSPSSASSPPTMTHQVSIPYSPPPILFIKLKKTSITKQFLDTTQMCVL